MALELSPVLAPHSAALVVAIALDGALGDPVYRAHPVRLMGHALHVVEDALRNLGATGYVGGSVLFLTLSALWVGAVSATALLAHAASVWLAWGFHLFILYSLLALGDLLAHGWRVERALREGDLLAARVAIAHLVGRDTDVMDAGACRRATIESLSENLTDGFISALFWYVVAGLPGLVLFKVVSTMDSMVGYKTARYLRFGWCGARLDDAMNFVPARLTWLLVVVSAAAIPGCSPRKGFQIGFQQHALLPGPNSGWSEAALAGAMQRRLIGPIFVNKCQVTDAWLGDPTDPPVETESDFSLAIGLIVATATVGSVTAIGALITLGWLR